MSIPSMSMSRTSAIFTSLLVFISVLVGLTAFSSGLWELVARWSRQEEYSHGFLIPIIVAWMLWARRDALLASVGRPSWTGPLLILLATIMHLVGELSSFFLMSQLGFLVALLGIVLGIGGYSLLRVAFLPIMFLVFAIPLPYFIDAQLSWRLQLISSELGRLENKMVPAAPAVNSSIKDSVTLLIWRLECTIRRASVGTSFGDATQQTMCADAQFTQTVSAILLPAAIALKSLHRSRQVPSGKAPSR